MYLHKEEAKKLLSELKNSLTKDLITQIDFLQELQKCDDWTLILKSYSLIEKVITDLIISKIEEPKLKKIITRLPLADEEFGKLLITKEYDLFSNSQRRFIKKLSNLRNKLVHNYDYVYFDMSKHIKSLDSNEIKSWHETVTWFANDESSKKQWLTISKQTPIFALWFSIFMFISTTIIKEKEYQGISKISEQAYATSEIILKAYDQVIKGNKDNTGKK